MPRICHCPLKDALGEYKPGLIRVSIYPSTDLLGFSPTPRAFIFHYTHTLLHELAHWAGANHRGKADSWEGVLARITRQTMRRITP